MSKPPVNDDITIVALLMNQTKMIQDLGERMGDLEEDVVALKAAQMRLMAFAGILGTVLGFTMGNIHPILAYIKGALA